MDAKLDGGCVLSFVVQYEVTVGDRRPAVVRYDCAHGFPHRDRYDRRSRLIDKIAMPCHLTRNEALRDAEHDLKMN